MKTLTSALCVGLFAFPAASQQNPVPAPPPAGGLTIYNGDLALVRELLDLELVAGQNDVSFTRITRRLQPNSVVLRGLEGTGQFTVLQQGYRNDPVSEGYLLSLFEGQEIEFLRADQTTVTGRIVRSGYMPPALSERGIRGGGHAGPVIEVEGKLRFELPGRPLFPSLGEDTVLEPTLLWSIQAERAGRQGFELGYLTGGLSWEADYNLVLPAVDGPASAVGWVTLTNSSGRAFQNVSVQLVAGEVRQEQPPMDAFLARRMSAVSDVPQPEAFDAYHLYSLPRPLTLRDAQSVQVEFLKSAQLEVRTRFVARTDVPMGDFRTDTSWFELETRVEVVREFENSTAQGLGVPLPKGTLRFYRLDGSGRMQFVGQAPVGHTPKDERVSVTTGRAFDLVAERKRVDFRLDQSRRTSSETIAVELRNRSESEVAIELREVLNRWHQNEVVDASHPARRLDASTVAFDLVLAPGATHTVTYTARYTW